MPKIVTKTRVILLIIVLAVAGLISWRVYKSKNDTSNILTETVQSRDLLQSVLATGQVVSNTDLSLSFKNSGTVSSVKVKTGQKVKADQVLATLDQRDQQASLTTARGALASAQANYQRILDGASSEEIQVAQKAVDSAQITLDNTRSQQDQAVENAHRSLLNGSLQAQQQNSSSTAAITITGYYVGATEGSYHLAFYDTGSGLYYNSTGLATVNGQVNFGVPLSLGNGLYFTVSTTGSLYTYSSWDIAVPNVSGATYINNYNAYQSALSSRDSTVKSAQAALDQALAQLNLKKAQARPADLSAASAQVLSAQGQVQAAQSAIENTTIRSPAAGTITKVDVKQGELATPSKIVIVVQDVDNLYLEANVSEANVALIKMGQPVDITFDALGPDRLFVATISNVEPASTVVSGVVNYKVTASIDQSPDIRPGMTANMSVKTDERLGVIAVPQRAIIQDNGKKYVRVIKDPNTKAYDQIEVMTGLEANEGLVEIKSGLSAGQEVVTFIGDK